MFLLETDTLEARGHIHDLIKGEFNNTITFRPIGDDGCRYLIEVIYPKDILASPDPYKLLRDVVAIIDKVVDRVIG